MNTYNLDTIMDYLENRILKLEKIVKKLMKSNNIVKPRKFGQDVKCRSGSTRNGFNNTFANYNRKLVTKEQLLDRNNKLNIKPNICMYCKVHTSKITNDHLIPTCNTSTSIFGQNNDLNIVPACSSCNGTKGGKSGEELYKWLMEELNWSSEEVDVLSRWINDNKDYLYFNKEEDIKYIIEQHKDLNIVHDSVQKSCINKEPILIGLCNKLNKIAKERGYNIES